MDYPGWLKIEGDLDRKRKRRERRERRRLFLNRLSHLIASLAGTAFGTKKVGWALTALVTVAGLIAVWKYLL